MNTIDAIIYANELIEQRISLFAHQRRRDPNRCPINAAEIPGAQTD
jgi:hypothetical protein